MLLLLLLPFVVAILQCTFCWSGLNETKWAGNQVVFQASFASVMAGTSLRYFRFCSSFRSVQFRSSTLPLSSPPPLRPLLLLLAFCFYASCGLQQISHLHEAQAAGAAGAGGSFWEGSLRKRRRQKTTITTTATKSQQLFFFCGMQVFNADWFFNVQQQGEKESEREAEREWSIEWQLGNFICGLPNINPRQQNCLIRLETVCWSEFQ